MSKDFKKYMTMYGPLWFSITLVVSILLVASIIFMIIYNDIGNFIPQLIMFVIALISLIPLVRSKRFFDRIEQDLCLPNIETEFINAISMRKDSVRFGENYIFIKHSGKLLKYSEITQVYQYIHKTNFVEDERALKYVNVKGKHCKMCKLELREKSNEELQEMLCIIMSKNPYIKIGYR